MSDNGGLFDGLVKAAAIWGDEKARAEAEAERARLRAFAEKRDKVRPYAQAILTGLGLDISNAVNPENGTGLKLIEAGEFEDKTYFIEVTADFDKEWGQHGTGYIYVGFDVPGLSMPGPYVIRLLPNSLGMGGRSEYITGEFNRDAFMYIPQGLDALQADPALRPAEWAELRAGVGLRVLQAHENAQNWIIGDREENAPASAPAPAEETPPVPSSTVEAVSLMRALHGVIDRRLSWHDLIDG